MSLTDFDSLDITEETLYKMSGVRRAIMETIRLRAPGAITRGVKEMLQIKVHVHAAKTVIHTHVQLPFDLIGTDTILLLTNFYDFLFRTGMSITL